MRTEEPRRGAVRRPPSAGLRGRKSGAVGPPPQGSGDRADRRTLPPDRARTISMADTRVTTFSRTAEKSRTSRLSNQLEDERILGYVLLVPAFLPIVAFITYLVPPTLLFIPLTGVISFLSLNDSSVSLMLAYPTFLVPFCIWLLIGYFQAIPREVEECVRIDGARRIRRW